MRYRLLHRIYAWLTGHFWIVCPVCGQEFGGHEWRDVNGKPSSIRRPDDTGVAICPECTALGAGEPGHLVFWKDVS